MFYRNCIKFCKCDSQCKENGGQRRGGTAVGVQGSSRVSPLAWPDHSRQALQPPGDMSSCLQVSVKRSVKEKEEESDREGGG